MDKKINTKHIIKKNYHSCFDCYNIYWQCFFINIMNKQTFKLNPIPRKNCIKDTKDKQIHSQFILQNCIISIRYTRKKISQRQLAQHISLRRYTYDLTPYIKQSVHQKISHELSWLLNETSGTKRGEEKTNLKRNGRKKIYKHIYIKNKRERKRVATKKKRGPRDWKHERARFSIFSPSSRLYLRASSTRKPFINSTKAPYLTCYRHDLRVSD